MHIQCTRKLLDFLNPEIKAKDTDNDLYSWHANYITINRKKLLIIMNDLTRFTVVFYNVRKKDFEKIHLWLISGIFNAMTLAGFSTEDIMKYLNGMPNDITYNRTKNRTLVARLNKSVEAAEWACYDEGVYIDVIEQNHISKYVNGSIIWDEKPSKKIYHPKNKLKEYLDLL